MNGKSTHPLTVLRTQAGLSQRKLGALSGVSFVTISHVETGRQDPQPQTLGKLAKVLSFVLDRKVTGDDLLPYAPDYNPDADPEVPNLRELGLDDKDVVIHLQSPRIEYLDERGKVVAVETPVGILVRAKGGTVVTVPAAVRGRSRAPRPRKTRKKTSGSSDPDSDLGDLADVELVEQHGNLIVRRPDFAWELGRS